MEVELIALADVENFKKDILAEIKRLTSGKSADQPDKKWLKSQDVQKFLGVTPGTLQTLKNRAMIPYSRLGGVIYYNQDEVRKVLENKGTSKDFLGRKFS